MLEPVRPLIEDVAENAFLAAFKDYRFEPVTADEFDSLEIHISVLTPAEPVEFDSEQSLIMQLRPGLDGFCYLSILKLKKRLKLRKPYSFRVN